MLNSYFCPALTRKYSTSPWRLVKFNLQENSIFNYTIPIQSEYISDYTDIYKLDYSRIEEISPLLRDDPNVMCVIFPTFDLTITVHATGFIRDTTGNFYEWEFTDETEWYSGDTFMKCGFERTPVFGFKHFIAYNRILYNSETKKYLYRDEWFSTNKSLRITNSKEDYKMLMNSDYNGLLAIMGGGVEFLC